MLKSPRLTLRAVTRDDLPRYVRWLNDPQVIEHLSLYLPMNIDDETEWYEAQRHQANTLNFAMDDERGTHIGSVSLMKIDHRVQSAELGIVIGDKSAWGKGYGTEAIGLLLTYAFNTLNLNRVFLRVDSDHPGAIACYTRCGFRKEGEMRQAAFRDGHFINQYMMSVLRTEYQERH